MSRLTAYLVPLFLTCSRLVGAQTPDSDFVERGPRFLLASAAAPVPVQVDVTRTPVLRQSISLDLNGVALGDALREISAKAGMQLAFSNTMLPPEKTVTFRADHITVAAALTEVLVDAQVDVLFSHDGRAVLVRRADFQGGTVNGRVTDAKTGKAVPNVSVYLEGTRWRATTGEDGSYRLVDVTAGTYTLMASRIGFAKQSQSVTVTAGQEATVNVELSAAATELEQVVVTGTIVPTERKALPTPISVVTAQDIAQQNLQRVDQIFRGQVPGAVAWDPGAFDNTSLIMVRGASSIGSLPRIKTYVDGVEVADAAYVANIDPNTVERIEIIRGPQASTLYGADALSGVMQIFTKKGQSGLAHPELTGKASAGGVGSVDGTGTKAMSDNTASLLGGGGAASYNLAGTYRTTGEWRPSYDSRYWDVSGGAQASQGSFTLSASARYSNNTFDDPWNTRFASYRPFSKPFYSTEDLRQQMYGLTLQYQVTSQWHNALTLGYDRTFSSQYQTQPRFTTPADSFLYVSNGDQAKTSLVFHTDVSLKFGNNVAATITAGVDHSYYDFQSSYTSGATKTNGFLDGSTSTYHVNWPNTGYFGQTQFGFGERFFLTGGLRAERNPNFGVDLGTAFSPRVGAAYLTPLRGATVKLRASYGESIRPPSIGASEASRTSTSVRLANPSLGPERQRGVDGGMDLYLAGGASFGVTYYNQRAIDLIDLVNLTTPSDTLQTYQSQNIGRVKNVGWEFEGRFKIGPVSIAGTYSITRSTVQQLSPTYTGDYLPGDKILGIPRTSGGATITYSPRPHTTLTASTTYFGHWTEMDFVAFFGAIFGGQPYRGSTRAYWIEYPAVTKVALGIRQDLTNGLGVFGRIENLGNTTRFEANNFNFVPMPREVIVGATYRY
jgi:outer membrane receptor protein involved in Fe transport